MRILYVQFTNPEAYPPLEHSSRQFANAGWEVVFLGTEAAGSEALRFPAHQAICVRRMKFYPPGVRQKLHYLLYAVWVLQWAILWRPQWVYASELLVCPIAWVLSFLPGVRVVYHE